METKNQRDQLQEKNRFQAEARTTLSNPKSQQAQALPNRRDNIEIEKVRAVRTKLILKETRFQARERRYVRNKRRTGRQNLGRGVWEGRNLPTLANAGGRIMPVNLT